MDNFPTNPGSGGVTFASDDIAGVHYPRVKLSVGAEGSAVDVSAAAPMPVTTLGADGSAVTNVAASAASVVVLAANADRKGAVIHNDSTATLYLVLNASVASPANYTEQLAAGESLVLERGDYNGEIRGIWAAAAGDARVTEFS